MIQPQAVPADPLVELEKLIPFFAQVAEERVFGQELALASTAFQEHEDLTERLKRLNALVPELQAQLRPRRTALIPHAEVVSNKGKEIANATDLERLKVVRHSFREAAVAVRALEDGVKTSWQERLLQTFSPMKSLGTLLSGIPHTRDVGQELSTWASRGLQLSGNGVPTAADMQAFRKLAAELPERKAALSQLGVSPSVERFLGAVASGRAKLTDLDAGVLKWLDEVGARGRFGVVSEPS